MKVMMMDLPGASILLPCSCGGAWGGGGTFIIDMQETAKSTCVFKIKCESSRRFLARGHDR